MNNPSENKSHLPLEEESLDIKKLLFQVIGNWYWFALTIFFCLFIAYMINRYTEQVYRVSSSLIVRDDDNMKGFTGAENLIQGLKLTRNTKSIQNEIGILKSYNMAHRTISELGNDFLVSYVAVGRRGFKETKLYKNSPFKVIIDSINAIPFNYPVYITILSDNEFNLEIDGGLNINKKCKFDEKIQIPNFNFKLSPRYPLKQRNGIIGRKFYFYLNNPSSLAKSYIGKIVIDVNDKKGSILSLTTTGYVAEQEADYLNKLMEVYISKGLEEKNSIAENTIRFIDSQLTDMSDSLKRAEVTLQKFRVNNRVIDLSAEGTMLLEQYKSFQGKKAEMELNSRYYNYLIDYLKSKKSFRDIVAPSSMGVDETQIDALLQQANQTYLQREEMLISSNRESPALNNIDTRLTNLKNSLLEKVNSLIEVNKIATKDYNNRILGIEKEMLLLPLNERQLINFERDFNLINKLYTYLLEKRAEAAIAKASNIPDNKVLDYALPENINSIKPNRTNNYLFGFVIGIALPLSVLLLFIFLNNKITDIKEIGSYTNTPIVGSVGHNKFLSNLPVIDKPKSTLTESFRGIRTNLQYFIRDPKQKVITVTSTISGEGKTFIAANLGAIISLTGKKVLVVGLDLRKPKLQNIFGSSFQKGLSTYLIGKDLAQDIVYSTDHANLYYAPSGPIPPNPAELIESRKMDEFIIWAKEHYDFVILDTPPIAIVTDALLTKRFSDIILFIVRFNYSNKEVLRLVESIKNADNQNNVALIINDIHHRGIYGYAYSYNYGYSYGYGYGSGYKYGSNEDGYYTDENELKPTWKEHLKRLFMFN